MNEPTQPPQFREHHHPALDEQWYDRYEKFAAFEPFKYLNGDPAERKKQKTAFLTGEARNPTLDYPMLNEAEIDAREEELLKLKDDVRKTEQNEVVRQTYLWRLNEKIAENWLLRAAKKGETNKFALDSEFVYGSPSEEVAAYTIQRIRKRIEQAKTSENMDLVQAAQDLEGMLPHMEFDPSSIPSLPNPETITFAHQQTTEEMKPLLDIPFPHDKGTYTSEELRDMFQQGMEVLKAKGWEAILDPSVAGVSMDHENKKIKIPVGKQYTAEGIKDLLVHEEGTHLKRRINGERSRLKILGLGLDRYEPGEEGVATMREQARKGKMDDFSGFDGHFAAAIATGIGDNTRKDFRDTFTVMRQYCLFRALLNGKTLEQANAIADNEAYDRCVRTFRGTDCNTPGKIFTKDIVYREGSIGVWNVISTDQKEMMRFSAGKYDPANPRHIWIMNQLGINAEDLKTLESVEA